VVLAYSPLLEAALSLHVLVEPRHHALQQPWVRRTRRLPQRLRHEIAALSSLYEGQPPASLFPSPKHPFPRFDEELMRLRSLDEELVAPVPADRLAALLQEYWELAFAEEWARLEPLLAEAVADASRVVATGTVYALLDTLTPPLRVEREAERFHVDAPRDATVEITSERPLVLVPSKYAWPHVFVSCDDPWPSALVYPAPFVVEDARPRIPNEELLRVLKALADDTRLRTLRLIAERPRSTQELAPLVPISEGGLSKHLRQLSDAGLVETQREGYYVLYSLTRERTATLSRALQAFLGS
jgi:DNA-binding transcriptional ArsR family regulator